MYYNCSTHTFSVKRLRSNEVRLDQIDTQVHYGWGLKVTAARGRNVQEQINV